MLWHFQTVEDVHSRLVDEGVATLDSRRASGTDFYGRFVRVEGVRFWLGVWWGAWASGPATPFWLQLLDDDTELWARGHAALDRLESQGTLTVSNYNDNVAVPLYPELGREYESVKSGLVDAVRVVAAEIRALRSAAGSPDLMPDADANSAPELAT